MKTHFRNLLLLLAALAFGFGFAASARAQIAVNNASFETPVQAPGGYTGTITGWTDFEAGGNVNNRFIEYVIVAHDGNQHLGIEPVRSVYQDLGVNYAANTVYRLRVAAGNRAGFTTAGNVTTYTLTDPAATATLSGTFDASTIAAGTFMEAPALLVDTALYPPLVGKTIRVRLTAGGAGRSHFDNVRLDTGSITVTNTNDSGAGSLRQALAYAASNAGPDTCHFDPALSGQTITLGSEIVVTDAGGVTLDASNLAGGVTIDGGAGTNRLFSNAAGSTLALRHLTLTGGGGTGVAASGQGGAIYSAGALTLENCTLMGNTATGEGGAVRSVTSALIARHCTVTQNTAPTGGGFSIADGGPAAVLDHLTVSGNTATSNVFGGGGLFFYDKVATLTNCLIAGNNSPMGPDANRASSSLIVSGENLIGNNATVNAAFPAGPLVGTAASPLNPRLAQLAANGGPTKTMALLPGSPALDAASVVSGLDTDQRGFHRNRDGNATAGALPDIGAYEAQVRPVSSVGFNFIGGGGGGPGAILLDTDFAGAPPFAHAYWNNLQGFDGTGTGTYTGGPSPLKDATGSDFNPNLKLWWDSTSVGSRSGSPGTADQKLMWGHLDSDGGLNSGTNLYHGQNQPFFMLAGLPAAGTAGGYKVVVYADTLTSDGSSKSSYWLTSAPANPNNTTGVTDLTQPLYIRDTANFIDTYTRVPATSTDPDGALSGNYLVFEGQTQHGFILRTEDATTGRAVINAVQVIRNELVVVTTAVDENDPVGTLNTGISLREALRDAPDGGGIVFDPALSGSTITLTSALGELAIQKNIVVDASSLAAGLTLNGGTGGNRIFYIGPYKVVSLRGLTLTGGNSTGSIVADNGFGGAIFNGVGSTLTLDGCTLSGNSATNYGGAIYNTGRLLLTYCTLAGNSADILGGAIYGTGTATLTHVTLSHCTLFGNSAVVNGGGIHAAGPTVTTLTHCTLAGNSNGGQSPGAGIYALGPTLTLTNCIVAGNSGGPGADVFYGSGSTLTRVGANIVQSSSNAAGGTSSGPAAINADPLLAPLGAYGGSTQTMALKPASPARNASVGSLATIDQRGFPSVGTPDIGAYEAGTFTNYNAWIWESLPVAASPEQRAAAFDYDGDGATNFHEWIALTNPASSTSVFRANAGRSAGNMIISFSTVTGKTYTLWRSDTLTGTWTNTGLTAITGDGGVKSFAVPVPASGVRKRFHRVQVGL